MTPTLTLRDALGGSSLTAHAPTNTPEMITVSQRPELTEPTCVHDHLTSHVRRTLHFQVRQGEPKQVRTSRSPASPECSRQGGQDRDRDSLRVRRASKAMVQPANDPDRDDGRDPRAMRCAAQLCTGCVARHPDEAARAAVL